MAGIRDVSDETRWPALFRRASEPIFVLNRRRRIIFANAAWERTTGVSSIEAKALTCTSRQMGGTHADVARTLAPPDEVSEGKSIQVRRPMPGQTQGPPWWDIDFLPLIEGGRPIAVVGRIRAGTPGAAEPRAILPAHWASLRQTVISSYSFSLWESTSAAIRRAAAQARLIARSDGPALIVGEKGTGKQTLARTIHANSSRAEMPCVCLDAAALPVEAIRLALIGPNAIVTSDRTGMLYLHEPAALPLDVQAEVLRTIVDTVQIIVGMTADPQTAVRSGKLSNELFSCVAVVLIELPPLRERVADMPRFIEQFAARHLSRAGFQSLAVSPEAIDAIQQYRWPNNLDELNDLIAGWIARGLNEVGFDAVPLAMRRQLPSTEPRSTALPKLDALLERIEARMIRLALERAGGNKSKAAEMLGIWRPRLSRGLETPEAES